MTLAVPGWRRGPAYASRILFFLFLVRKTQIGNKQVTFSGRCYWQTAELIIRVTFFFSVSNFKGKKLLFWLIYCFFFFFAVFLRFSHAEREKATVVKMLKERKKVFQTSAVVTGEALRQRSSVGYQDSGREERCTMEGFAYSTLHYGAPTGQVGW